MRGGISCISKGLHKVNNKYMKSYDNSKPSKYIMYLDANNLYGWAMIPYSEFKWLNQKEIDRVGVNSLDGYILGVDLEYSDELHELQNDYTLAPEKLEINHGMLSKHCRNIAN